VNKNFGFVPLVYFMHRLSKSDRKEIRYWQRLSHLLSWLLQQKQPKKAN